MGDCYAAAAITVDGKKVGCCMRTGDSGLRRVTVSRPRWISFREGGWPGRGQRSVKHDHWVSETFAPPVSRMMGVAGDSD